MTETYTPKKHQVSRREIGKCRDCEEDLAWLTSSRTGKKYPVNLDLTRDADPFEDETWHVIGNDFHKCRT